MLFDYSNVEKVVVLYCILFSLFGLLTMSSSREPASPTSGPPLYGMPVAQQFLSDDEKTFQHDDSLPSLPVPPLHRTLSRYLDSGTKCAVSFRCKLLYLKCFGCCFQVPELIGNITQVT